MHAVCTSLEDRFSGCLIGLAIGDALGSPFEGQSATAIRDRCPTVERLIAYPREAIWYTDDTQMAIGVAEALVESGEIVEDVLCRTFAANYDPARGYGSGTHAVLRAIRQGRDHHTVAEQYLPGGSFGNGAAMRVGPVGLLFRDDRERLLQQARLSALPTHRHPLGIEGAQLLALAVGIATRLDKFDRSRFFDELTGACVSPEYQAKLELAAQVEGQDDLAALGNGIEALHSVPTAIASFARTPESYVETVGNVILLGGDTDTLAAMAGAVSGAYLGVSGLPDRLLELLEDKHKGREYIGQLGHRLFGAYSRNRTL